MLEAWDEFDLATSLKASFSLPLFEQKSASVFVKAYGHRAGLRLEGRLGLVLYGGCSLLEASFLCGAWFDPFEGASRLRRRTRSIIYELLQVFPGLGLAIDPWDLRAMFYSIFLSRNTDYHANTVRWVHQMALEAKDEAGLALLDPREFGSSYQLAQLAEIKDELGDVLASLSPGPELVGSEGTYSLVKKRLLSLPHVGPKTVHAFGLFCFGLTQLAPADRHLLAISRGLGLVSEDVRAPRKELCVRYECYGEEESCPQAPSCLTALLMRELGHMAGWLQTASFPVSYTHLTLPTTERV
mgnify:CR=1 FL=1